MQRHFFLNGKNSPVNFATSIVKSKLEECEISSYGNMKDNAVNLNLI